MTSTWIAIDDRQVDGDVELVTVRNQHGVRGIRVRPREGDLQDFDHYYAEISNHPAVPIIERTPGEVVFADCEPPATIDLHAVAVDVLEAIGQEPRLAELSPNAFRLGENGRLRILPRWRPVDRRPAGIAAAHFLMRIAGEGDDPRVERAIEALLDPSPEIRQTARSLLRSAPSPPAQPARVQFAVTAAERRSQSLARPDARAAAVIEPQDLRRLDAAGRSAAAGLSGLPTSVLDGLVAADLPLVLETHARAQSARIAAARLVRQTSLPVTATTGGSMFTLLAASALGTTSLVTATGSLMLTGLGLFSLPLLGGVVSLALSGVTLWSLVEWNTDRRKLNDANDAAREAREERAIHRAHPEVARAWGSLCEARASVAVLSLPTGPAAEALALLAAAERELIRIGRRSTVIQRGLASTSSAEVQHRLDAIDPDDENQSRRALTLTQTLTELMAMEDERSAMLERCAALEEDLAGLNRALQAWEPGRPVQGIEAALQLSSSPEGA